MFTFSAWEIDNGQLSNRYLEETIYFHASEWTFSRRMVLTTLIDGTSSVFNISSSLSFVLLNSFILFLAGDQLGKLTAEVQNNWKAGKIGTLLFFTCFPIIFCFFAPVYTFDDLLQVLLLITSVRLLLQSRWQLFSAAITLAMLTRESTLLIVPLLWLFVPDQHRKQLWLNLIPGTVLTILLWGYHFFDGQSTLFKRVACLEFNFCDLEHCIESVLSLLMVLSISRCFMKFSPMLDRQKRMLAIVALGFHTLVILMFACAREIRLFYLPLYLLIPFAANGMNSAIQNSLPIHISNFSRSTLLQVLVYLVVFVTLFFTLHSIYSPSIAKTSEIAFEIVFATTLCLCNADWLLNQIDKFIRT